MGSEMCIRDRRSPLSEDYKNRTFVREAILELSYPPPIHEPDFSLPLSDLMIDDPQGTDELPLPAISDPPNPAGLLEDFWSGHGSL